MAVDSLGTRFRPYSDYLLVEMDPPREEGQVILPNGMRRDAEPQTGVVRAMGPGLVLPSGTLAPMPCAVGERVVLQFNAGTELILEGLDRSKTWRMVPARDLFGGA